MWKVDPTARSRAIDPKILSESRSEVKRSTHRKSKEDRVAIKTRQRKSRDVDFSHFLVIKNRRV
jgi:hypothetical protein